MLLAYLDESYTKERYYVGAVLVPDAAAGPLTKSLDEIVTRVAAEERGLTSETELHAHELVTGKRSWAALRPKMRARIGVYHDAIQTIVDHETTVIVSGVDITRLHRRYSSPDHPHSIALAFLAERIDEEAESRGERALLIADEVDQHDVYRRDLWGYQRNGTWGYRARTLHHVVDTMYFAPSNASRLLQAADLTTYLYRRRDAHTETDARAEREWGALWDRLQPVVRRSRCWCP
ncbi:MAG: DUF3800 domain-containing protein [Actinobacteria bacterium]|nr:DUF3800 domain-containing protein [Actinomycetota bacterium]